jgi:hypothetical protein
VSLAAEDGERRNFHRSARSLPAARRRAGHISSITTSQVTASIHDFAVSLGSGPGQFDLKDRKDLVVGQRAKLACRLDLFNAPHDPARRTRGGFSCTQLSSRQSSTIRPQPGVSYPGSCRGFQGMPGFVGGYWTRAARDRETSIIVFDFEGAAQTFAKFVRDTHYPAVTAVAVEVGEALGHA